MANAPLRMEFLTGYACWLPPEQWCGTRFAARRMFFEGHFETHCNRHMVCNACGLPTLTLQIESDYCSACDWEDDFSEDPYADEISKMNGGVSLNQARRNILEKGTMFCDTDRNWMHPTSFEKIFSRRAQAHRDKLFQLFDELMTYTDAADVDRQWATIDEHWRTA
ncbi:CPCC family cysteine-rich protein [Marinobacterium lacunae]|nr:CPCC family cysteine-rich protein [Marinobacterium lacunae]